jgi:hypothetical protein
MTSEIHTGACLCGAVRFKTRGQLRGVVYCHCTQCRRQSTHHYAMTNVVDTALEVSGSDHVQWFEASTDAKRGFCKTCGSALFWKHKDLDYTSVSAGAFDAPSGLQAESHIFVADKGDYYEINDGLPQYARSTPDLKVAGD